MVRTYGRGIVRCSCERDGRLACFSLKSGRLSVIREDPAKEMKLGSVMGLA